MTASPTKPMQIYNHILEPADDLTNVYSHEVISAWFSHEKAIMKLLKWQDTSGRNIGGKTTSIEFFRELETMTRSKGKGQSEPNRPSKFDDRKQVRSDDIKWLNRRLDSDDLDNLESSKISLSELALDAVMVADSGVGFSIRSVDEGKSQCVTFIRPDIEGRGYACGMSSYGTTVRDALLAQMYKLGVWLEGDISNLPDIVANNQQNRRFG